MITIITQRWNKYIECQKAHYSAAMQRILENIDEAIEQPWKILKNDATSTVVVLKVDDRLIVVKRANTKNIIHFCRRLWWRTRAKKNWQFALKLNQIGVNTVEPIAYIEERYGWLKGRCYFIANYLAGIEARYYFDRNSPYKAKWPIVAHQLAEIIHKLSAYWISHRDLNLTNIIVLDDKPWLIDLDSMRTHWWRKSAVKGMLRERHRLLENWLDFPDLSPEVCHLFKRFFKELDNVKN